MIKLPFSRKTQDEPLDRPSLVFAAYGAAERERRRDTADGLDESAFRTRPGPGPRAAPGPGVGGERHS